MCTGLHRSAALSCGLNASSPGGCRMEMHTLPSGKTLGCLDRGQGPGGAALEEFSAHRAPNFAQHSWLATSAMMQRRI